MYIVIWQSPDKLYYKVVKGTYKKYYTGYENQYSHRVLLVIDLMHDLGISFYKSRYSLRDISCKYLRHLLKKLERR